jgi:hypothetical protein
MLSANSAFVLKTGNGDGSQHFEKLPTNSGMIGTDENGNPIDRTYDMYKVKVNSSDANAGYLDAKIADATDVQFTPTDDNSAIDSIVYQLTGIGARLVAKDTGSFQWQGATYGSTLGGRGICSGRVYLSGIDTQVWACNDGVGAIYKTLDDWKTITLDNSWMTFMGGDPTLYNIQPPCIKFVYSSYLSSYMWVITHWPGYGPYYYSYALHTPSNYNTDGTLKSTAWVTVECPQVMADIGVGPDNVALFVGNHDKVYRTTDWNTWTLVYTAPSSHVIGGIDTDGYGNWVIVERDYGVVHISQDNGLTWTTPSIFVRNTEEGEYAPAANLGTAGAVVAGNGIWLVASGNAYNYSTDGIYWTRYVTSLGSFYGMGFDGVKFFATNPMVAQDTKIWQLLVSEIPAHRHLVAEEGITVDKAAYLPFLPSATSLATDAMGKVVAGTAITEADLGEPDYDDYVLGKPSGTFQWIPRDGLTGVVESPLPNLTINGGAGTVTVAAMTIQAYHGSEFFGNPQRYQTAETTLSIPDGGNAYYIAFKDDMGPTIFLTDDKASLNLSNRIPLYLVSRIGTSIHSIGFDTQGVGLPQKAEKALLNTTPYRRSTDGGLALSEDGSRHILLTAASVYAGTTPVDVLAYNSNTSNHLLTHAYHTAGVWTYSTVSAGNGQYDNSNYDNGTNLVALGTNKYKVVWVFRTIGDDKEVFYVDSTSEYNSSDAAQAAQVPAIPPIMQWHCMLVGRIIVQNGASSGIAQSAFDTVFSASAISNHNNLSGLQGGTSGEYYHFTEDEHSALQNLANSVGKFAPTMDPSAATDVMLPSLVGTRSEICVCMVPRVDMKITSASEFATAMTQGATGTLIMTLRDVNYNLIAMSNTLTNPTGSALLTAGMNTIEDPITHATITEYTLTAGTVYYLGLNYSMNGAGFIGVIASQTMNITPIVAKKFDNLSSAPDTLSGGSETTMRFYIRIKA